MLRSQETKSRGLVVSIREVKTDRELPLGSGGNARRLQALFGTPIAVVSILTLFVGSRRISQNIELAFK